MNTNDIKQRLITGNDRFISDALIHQNENSNRRQSLTKGQKPYAIILSCADSRVVPELIFDCGLGELFVVRVAGNIANNSSIASIEYAVAHCHAQVIVVLGHQSCGAVTAACNGGDNGHHLNHLLAHIAPAVHGCGDKPAIDTVIKKNATLTAQALLDRSDILKNAHKNSTLEIYPAYYSLDTGKVGFLD